MTVWIAVYNQDINFESPSYQTKSHAYSKQMKSGDRWLMSRDGRIEGEAFINGDLNDWDNLVISLAGIKRIIVPYPTPGDPKLRCFPITPLTEVK